VKVAIDVRSDEPDLTDPSEELKLEKVPSTSWKEITLNTLAKKYKEDHVCDLPEYSIIDIFLHIDVKSDKTVNR
jgi:hypothetical protein